MIIELQVVLFSMNNDTEIVSFFFNNHIIKEHNKSTKFYDDKLNT